MTQPAAGHDPATYLPPAKYTRSGDGAQCCPHATPVGPGSCEHCWELHRDGCSPCRARHLAALTQAAERHTVDSITSDTLDQLYAELDRLRARVQDWRTSTGAGMRLADELRAERDALAAGVPLVCSDERHKMKVFALEIARNAAEQRAERAEALAAERWERIVKQSNLLQELKRDSFHLRMDIIALLEGRMGEIGPSDIRPGDISRAALDEHQEQPATHVGCGRRDAAIAAIEPALEDWGEHLPIGARIAVADAVLAAIGEPKEPQ